MAPSSWGCGEGLLNEGIIIKGTGSMPQEGFAKSHLLTTSPAHGRSPSICWPPSGLWQALSISSGKPFLTLCLFSYGRGEGAKL